MRRRRTIPTPARLTKLVESSGFGGFWWCLMGFGMFGSFRVGAFVGDGKVSF